MSVGLILLILLIIMLCGGLGLNWGAGPNGAVGVILLVVIILLVMGRI